MDRRSSWKNYMLPGIYHITVKATETLRMPFGKVVGNIDKPDGDPEAPRVVLTPVGEMVEHELLHSIGTYYPMVEVQYHVVMPEHLHFIVVVKRRIMNRQGRVAHLGQVIAGFKLGCNHRWWKMTRQQLMRPEEEDCQTAESRLAEPAGTGGGRTAEPAGTEPAGTGGGRTTDGRTAEPAGTGAGRFRREGPHHIATLPSLFQEGYCDVMPIDEAQLEQQRAYIKGNPRSRLMRTSNREWLQPKRGGVDTALKLSALHGYLKRECAPSQATADAFALNDKRLLLRKAGWRNQPEREEDGRRTEGRRNQPEREEDGQRTDGRRTEERRTEGQRTDGGGTAESAFIDCDTYGDRKLLERRLLPVVCHRKDEKMRARQQARCLEEAGRGSVLVSPRIAKGEQAIIDEAANRGFATILIADNGFAEIYHPSAERITRCAEGRLLIVTPWEYHYRRKDEGITVMECKTMNCLAQALCRTRDDWWKGQLAEIK